MWLFLNLLVRGAGAIAGAVENEQSKNGTRRIDENGNVICYGSKCEKYVNGEKTYTHFETDKYGNSHKLTIGCNSGKVYEDSYDRTVKQRHMYDEMDKERNLKYGHLAYNKYYQKFDRRVTTEISTGKVIACLYDGKNPETHRQEYRKFYLAPNAKRWDETAKGDYGIVISREEYHHLKIICCSASILPSDPDVKNWLWNTDVFK